MSLSIRRRGLIDEYKGYNFRRESMAQDSAGKLIYPHNARFEQGPFGSDKAILVEEGTTNLISNPSFENDFSSWVNWGTPPTREIVTSPVWHDSKALHLITNANNQGVYRDLSLTAGITYTVSCWVYVITGQPVIMMEINNGGVISYPPTVANPSWAGDGQWHRLTYTFTAGSTSNRLCIGKSAAGAIGEYYFDAVQLEQKPYATTFTPSVRANESLMVPIEGLLSPQQGTIELWYNDNGINKNKIVFKCGDLKFNPVSVTKGWHLISVIWDGVDTNYYIDKELVSTTNSPTELGSLYLGSDGDIDFINSLISHLRLSSIARTQEQLAPLDKPPEVDEYTTLYLPFNGADNTRAARSISI